MKFCCAQSTSDRWGQCPRRPKILRRAFTLIEIMVVVAILGLVASLGVPAMIKAMQKEGMRKALSDIEDVCFNARQRAIYSRQKTSVLFLPQERKFSVEGGGGGPQNGKVTSATLPDGIEFAMLDIFHRDFAGSEWARVFFYPDGTSDEVVIVLLGRGESHKITLDYATGMPTVSDVNK
jgi:prepilin-type N-terminal cleavage/methylation domain-containing protein